MIGIIVSNSLDLCTNVNLHMCLKFQFSLKKPKLEIRDVLPGLRVLYTTWTTMEHSHENIFTCIKLKYDL